jgi:hypothetical protein
VFNAPDIITKINDIAQIYRINDQQIEELEAAIQQLDDNIFFDRMGEDIIVRWENILAIIPSGSDTFPTRRARIKTKVIGQIPCTYRGVFNLVSSLLGDELSTLIIDTTNKKIGVYLWKTHRNDGAIVEDLLEDILPLDYTYYTEVNWNDHKFLSNYRHEELSMYTHEELRYF